jgi:hypothetical protein
VSVDLDERISHLVAAHRHEREELVRQKIDEELAHLVDAELERRRNGANGITHSKDVIAEKVCRGLRPG